MGCCDKGRTYREASGLETELANALTQKEVAVLGRLVKAAGCPAGQHKHAPYDYCHPANRKHHGYTDEAPAGGLEAAHGVLDEAIAEARAIGATEMAHQFGRVKGMIHSHDPAKAYKQLQVIADSFDADAKRYIAEARHNPKLRGMHLKARAMAKKVRQAAGRLKAEVEPSAPGEGGKGEGPGVGHEDVQRMSGEELRDHYKKLKDYVESQGRAGKEVAAVFYERGAAVEAEIKRRIREGNAPRLDEPAPPRGQGAPTARDEAQTQAPGASHPGRGKKVLDQLKGRIKEIGKRAKNAPPGSRARARAKASLKSLKEIEKKVREQIERQEGATEKPKPYKANDDIRGMEDDDLADKLKRLSRFVSTKGGELDKETYIMANDRLAVMLREARVRGLKGHGFGREGPGPGAQ